MMMLNLIMKLKPLMKLMLKLLVNFVFVDEAAEEDKYSDEADYDIESVDTYDDEGDKPISFVYF